MRDLALSKKKPTEQSQTGIRTHSSRSESVYNTNCIMEALSDYNI